MTFQLPLCVSTRFARTATVWAVLLATCSAASAGLTLSGDTNYHAGRYTDIGIMFSGTMTVNSSPNVTTNTTSHIGYGAPGTLNLESGATFNATGLQVGVYSFAQGLVDLTGASALKDVGHTIVGYYDNGTIKVLSGSSAQLTLLELGVKTGSSGTVLVDGSGSTLTSSGDIKLGLLGTATLTVSNGGSATGGTVTVGSTGAGTLNVDSGSSVNATSMTITSSTGTVTLSGGTLGTTSGLTDNGTLSGYGTINGAVQLNAGTVAGGTSASNVLTFTGSVAGHPEITGYSKFTGTYDPTATLILGQTADGHMTISSGGTLNSNGLDVGSANGDTGTLTITGSGSSLTDTGTSVIHVGADGTGTLTVENGATATLKSNLYLGYAASGSGTVTVDGAGSSLVDNAATTVLLGDYGSGTLNVTNGGSAQFSGTVDVGGNSGSSGAIHVDGSSGTATLTTDQLYVGMLTSGTVSLGDYGKIVSNSIELGSAGTMSISGGTLSVSGALSNDHTLTQSGGLLDAGSETIDSGATTTVTGGNHDVTGALEVKSGGTLHVTGGSVSADTLTVDSGAASTLAGGSLTTTAGLTDDGTLSGYGTIAGSAQLNADVTGGTSAANPLIFTGIVHGAGNISGYSKFTGTYAPGNSPAKVTLGSPTFAGTLSMDLGGTTPGTGYDQIVVTGTATLGGKLSVDLLNGFKPSSGDTFTLIKTSGSGKISGQFTTYNLPDLADHLVFQIRQSDSAFELIAKPSLIDGATDAMQHQTQTALNQAIDRGQLTDVTQAVLTLPTDQQAAALTNLSDRISMDQFRSGLAAAQIGFAHIIQRLSPLHAGTFGPAPVADADGRADLFTGNRNATYLVGPRQAPLAPHEPVTSPWSAFVMGGYTHLEHGDTAHQLGYHAQSFDLTVGMDRYVLDGKARIGGAFSTSQISANNTDAAGHTHTNTYSAIAYGRYDFTKDWRVMLSGSYSYAHYGIDRVVQFPGYRKTAHGNTRGNVFATEAQLVKTIHLGHGWQLLPQVGAQYVIEPISGYTEHGADGADMTYAGYTSQSLISSLSAAVATHFAWGDNHLRPYVSVGWDHQFLGNAQKITTAFVGSPGTSFSSIVDSQVRNALTVGAGASDRIGSNVEVFADYAGRFGQQHAITHRVQVGVRVYF